MTPRAGSIARLASELTPTDHAILATVVQHRFVTRRHVQALHFADRPTELAAARAAGRTLRRLVNLGVLATLDRRIGGVRAGSTGLVYRLGPKGRLIHARRAGRPLPRFAAEPSVAFLDHTLAIADVHAELVRQANAGTIELTEFVAEPTCWRTYLNAGGGKETLKPDAFAAWALPRDNYETVAFIEVDMGTESIPRVLRKCQQYETYRRTGVEQRAQGTWPRVIWIAGDANRVKTMSQSGLRDVSCTAITMADLATLFRR